MSVGMFFLSIYLLLYLRKTLLLLYLKEIEIYTYIYSLSLLQKQNIPSDYEIPVSYIPKEVVGMKLLEQKYRVQYPTK